MNERVTKKTKIKLRVVFKREKLKGEIEQLSSKLKLNDRKTFSYFEFKFCCIYKLHCDFS